MGVRCKSDYIGRSKHNDYGIITDMEQTPHSPGRSPELPAVSPQPSGEFAQAGATPEVQIGSRIEQGEQREGATPVATDNAVLSPQLPTPVVAIPSDDATVTPQADDDLPSVAGDDDLIEKEWVAKTKKVLAETKDDPYRREQEVGRIQYDYILKRYGRELGSSGDR